MGPQEETLASLLFGHQFLFPASHIAPSLHTLHVGYVPRPLHWQLQLMATSQSYSL